MTQQRDFPDWDKLYREERVESLPWFNPTLDGDLDEALTKLNISTGMALDLGTGPGTQAIILAERGYKVTATDISATAINQARVAAGEKGLDIAFRQDDILNSNLSLEFDFVFDRGCFHVLPPNRRQDYVLAVHSLIKHKGYLFLKCFSHLEKGESGPYRFTPKEIGDIFINGFNVVSVKETVYQGTLDRLPQALFCILEKQ
ncbi:methyltransferase domain-containing protein [Scytonema sp. UIC 10036]|uniref:class I SAM-dependent methyltransferase n=1 Tax=Scytonema sp. UIC 10036 TaxID=2304196 RepID=UPI0012DAAD65|nr:class I SAM-dependent methyltransferase [Scytonema sp. UIC 10036]MUG96237.1 methyltransferase domain-containing protein [Scytonema sp. UIC 10036]